MTNMRYALLWCKVSRARQSVCVMNGNIWINTFFSAYCGPTTKGQTTFPVFPAAFCNDPRKMQGSILQHWDFQRSPPSLRRTIYQTVRLTFHLDFEKYSLHNYTNCCHRKKHCPSWKWWLTPRSQCLWWHYNNGADCHVLAAESLDDTLVLLVVNIVIIDIIVIIIITGP